MSGEAQTTDGGDSATGQRWLVPLTALVVILTTIRLVVPLVVDPDPFLDGWLEFRRATEAGIALVAFSWALRRFDLRWIIDPLGPTRVIVLGLVLLFMVLTQYTTHLGTQYPFSAWSMYSLPTQERDYVAVSVRRHGDVNERIAIAEHLPSITPRPFAATLLALSQMVDADVDEAEDLLEATLLELGSRAGAVPGDQVILEVCTVAKPTPQRPSTCVEAFSTNVPGGGADR